MTRQLSIRMPRCFRLLRRLHCLLQQFRYLLRHRCQKQVGLRLERRQLRHHIQPEEDTGMQPTVDNQFVSLQRPSYISVILVQSYSDHPSRFRLRSTIDVQPSAGNELNDSIQREPLTATWNCPSIPSRFAKQQQILPIKFTYFH